MLKAIGVILISLGLSSISSLAQGPCPTANSTATTTIPTRSGDLICLVPQVYGGGGLVGSDHGGPLFSTAQFSHAAHFTSSALQSFSPLNAEIGTQLSQLPFSSPASGFIFSFNPSLGVVTRQTENFGPILTERADTIGKHKLFVGFSYQYFNFDKADGVDLKNFGVVFQHESEAELCTPGSPITCVDGEPVFQRDIIATQNRIDLKVHQFTAVGTFGVTDRLDLSVAIPILDVRMAVFSDATINSFETATDIPPCCVHRFDPANADPHENLITTAHATFFNNNNASGIGDVIFRGKFQVLRREKAGLAVGLDVHTPTGDEKNFLGIRNLGTEAIRDVFVCGTYLSPRQFRVSKKRRFSAGGRHYHGHQCSPARYHHLLRRCRRGPHASGYGFCGLPRTVLGQRQENRGGCIYRFCRRCAFKHCYFDRNHQSDEHCSGRKSQSGGKASCHGERPVSSK